jgi:D-beta-D-heptose 7-phosphate kinase/D-beta-D-heptose 1-phosphate adenosyltransferase
MSAVSAVLEAARGRTVVVLGDLMLDEWIVGEANRISPEAPVPILRFTARRTAPGGAANVAMNLLRLGARVRVCGVVGDDEAGADLARELDEVGIDTSGLVVDATRPTTLKTRIVAQRQQMVRVDRESQEPLSRAVQDELRARSQHIWNEAAVLCLSDYDKGLATCGVFDSAIADALSSTRSSDLPPLRITGGPKPHNLNCFSRTDFLSLNQKEASEASGLKLDSIEAIECAGEALLRQLGVQALVITLGGRGLTLFQNGQSPRHIGGHEVEVFDVAGAGDTFLAAATIALAGGADYVAASELGNLAAAASVRHVGVVAVTPEEVRHVAQENEPPMNADEP